MHATLILWLRNLKVETWWLRCRLRCWLKSWLRIWLESKAVVDCRLLVCTSKIKCWSLLKRTRILKEGFRSLSSSLSKCLDFVLSKVSEVIHLEDYSFSIVYFLHKCTEIILITKDALLLKFCGKITLKNFAFASYCRVLKVFFLCFAHKRNFCRYSFIV